MGPCPRFRSDHDDDAEMQDESLVSSFYKCCMYTLPYHCAFTIPKKILFPSFSSSSNATTSMLSIHLTACWKKQMKMLHCERFFALLQTAFSLHSVPFLSWIVTGSCVVLCPKKKLTVCESAQQDQLKKRSINGAPFCRAMYIPTFPFVHTHIVFYNARKSLSESGKKASCFNILFSSIQQPRSSTLKLSRCHKISTCYSIYLRNSFSYFPWYHHIHTYSTN